MFNSILLFAPQKKAEAAHRILEGLGPQVELVSQARLGWGGRIRVEEWGRAAGVGGVGGREGGGREVCYWPALSPRRGRKQHLLIRTLADNS